MKRNFLLSIFGAATFFVASFVTLNDYGISWDETIHFRRGQAYLNYFLTSSVDYSNLKEERRSFYQNDYHNAKFFLHEDTGHPPLNDILAATLNYIFYQKLGVLGDIFSFHLFNIIIVSLLVFIIIFWSLDTFGVFAALVSFLSLVLYPLFFSEAHFNIKDPPQAAFFTATIWAFWESLKRGNVLWLLLSVFFFSLALGTKFNILFLPFIILPYLFYRYWKNFKKPKEILSKIPPSYLLGLVVGPVLILIIFLGSWPYLRQNVLVNFPKIVNYYKQIGTGSFYQPENFFIFGFNTFPWQWIIYTTPPIVLILSLIGIISAWLQRNLKNGVGILWVLWLLVPILRVSLPNTVIYGGIRQSMEFLPALSLLCGLGAWQVLQWLKRYKLSNFFKIVLMLLFLWPTFVLIKLHPNENVYFNFLIGGLKGAQERNFPSWGNSFGNAYLQGIWWLNKNAEYGAKLALIQGTAANAPQILLRKDFDYQNANFSGIKRGGEYLMELDFNDTSSEFHYAWEYVEKFLNPVYELKVDDVTILNIWKNDLGHTKPEYKKQEVIYQNADMVLGKNIITINLKEEETLSRLELNFNQNKCLSSVSGFVETSRDGINWFREGDVIPYRQVGMKSNLDGDTIDYFFAGRLAKYIRYHFYNNNSCDFSSSQIKIVVLR